MTVSVTIRIHQMMSLGERRDLAHERNRTGKQGKQPPICGHFRKWTNTTKDRYNGGHVLFGLGGFLQPPMPAWMGTRTQTIWGIAGKMADVQD